MLNMSISRALTWLAEQAPDAFSIADDARELTRAQVDAETNRLARAYVELGVRKDDLVTIALPNGVEFLLACCAVWKAGATPQPISSRLPLPERQAIVELAGTPLVVGADPADHPGRATLPVGYAPPPELGDGLLPDLESVAYKAPTSGGSTGRPKIIVSGRGAWVDPTRSSIFYMPERLRQLVVGPMYHNGPFAYSTMGLLCGHSVRIHRRFDAEATLAALERHKIEWVMMVPTMMQRIWRLPPDVRGRYDLSSLRTVVHTGGPAPRWLKEAWIEWIGGEKILEVYGGTEGQAGSIIRGDDWLRHPGSVGKASPGGRFAVLDDAGNEVPRGTVGEVYMLPDDGPGTTYHYVGAEPKARGGWETLGDLGRMDADGYLYLTDRSADLVVSGGQNVYPAEVEAVLDAHPAVRSSAVFGLPDDDLGERVYAVVDVEDATVDPAALIAWVGERLARYKVPRDVELVREPLRDDAGKVRRSALKQARLPVTAR